MPIRLLTPPTLGSPRPRAPGPSLHRAPKGRGLKRPTSASEPVTLRLAIGREGIGIELAQSVRTGCLCVAGLSATLPGTRFPIDVSGGVPRFRHRRAFLQRVELEVDARGVERWAAPRLRGLVSTQMPEVWVCARAAGATVCVSGAPSIDNEDFASASPIVAFEVCAIAIESDLAFVVERARGSNLPVTATAMAIACVEALLGPLAYRTGATFLVARPSRAARAVTLSGGGSARPGL